MYLDIYTCNPQKIKTAILRYFYKALCARGLFTAISYVDDAGCRGLPDKELCVGYGWDSSS